MSAGVSQPIDEIANIYGKARVQGRLFAEDINQLTERGIPIIQELAKQFGVSEGEVKKLVESGQVGFPQLEQAFTDLTSEGGRFFNLMEAQSASVGGKLSNFADNFTKIQIAAFEAFGPALGGGLDLLNESLAIASENVTGVERLTAASQGLGDALGENPELAQALGEALAELASTGVGQAAAALEELTAFIEENPEAIQALIDQIVDWNTTLIDVVGFLTKAGIGVADFVAKLDPLMQALNFISNFNPSRNLLRLFGALGSEGESAARAGQGLTGLADAARGLIDGPTTETPDAAPAAQAPNTDQQLEAIARANAQAEAAIEQSVQTRIAAVRQAEAAGVASAQEAADQIAEIEQAAVDERLAQRQAELAEVQVLRESGLLTAEEAADREIELSQEIGELNLARIEAEIEAVSG